MELPLIDLFILLFINVKKNIYMCKTHGKTPIHDAMVKTLLQVQTDRIVTLYM